MLHIFKNLIDNEIKFDKYIVNLNKKLAPVFCAVRVNAKAGPSRSNVETPSVVSKRKAFISVIRQDRYTVGNTKVVLRDEGYYEENI